MIDLAVGNAPFEVTRDVVPCEYEITGEMRSDNFQINFRRTPPYEGGGGVEFESIVAEEGPLLSIDRAGGRNCGVGFLGRGAAPPFRVRVEFRVSPSGNCGV